MSKLKLTILTLLILALGTVVSACVKKSLINTNKSVNQNASLNINEPIEKPNPYWEIDYENWETFTNEQYGYQIDVPPGWDVRFSLDSERKITDYNYIYINKKGEKAQFPFIITVAKNPNRYSSKEFAKWGEGYYEKEYETIIGDNYKAYEFYNVWAGDQGDERIFLAKGSIVVEFSFPIAKENPNLDNPIENNQLIYQALKTFKFIEKK